VVVYKERATRVNLLTESSDPFTTNVFCFHLFEYNLPTSRININRQTKKKGKITHFNEIDIALGFFDRHVNPPPYPHPTPQAKRDFLKIKTFFKREIFLKKSTSTTAYHIRYHSLMSPVTTGKCHPPLVPPKFVKSPNFAH
jgi:hypothetical protein